MPGDDSTGGQGDCVRFGRADLRLMRRAARERWGVPDDLKNEGIFQAARFLASGRPELVSAALKFFLAADKADLVADRLALDREKLEHLKDGRSGGFDLAELAVEAAALAERRKAERGGDRPPDAGGPGPTPGRLPR